METSVPPDPIVPEPPEESPMLQDKMVLWMTGTPKPLRTVWI